MVLNTSLKATKKLQKKDLHTAQKVSVFRVFLVRISPYSVRMWENTTRKTQNTDTFRTVADKYIIDKIIV